MSTAPAKMEAMTQDSWFKQLSDLLALPDHLAGQRLPTIKDEPWKFTPISGALKAVPVQQAALQCDTVGFVTTEQSTGSVATINQDVPTETGLLPALIPYNTKGHSFIANPQPSAKVVNLSQDISALEAGISMTRTVASAAAGQSVTLIERAGSRAAHWLNQLHQITVQRDAVFTHIVVHDGSDDAIVTRHEQVRVEEGGRYTALHIMKETGLVRQETTIDLIGAHAQGQVYGLTLGCAKNLLDQTILIRHMAPDCQSDQFVRTILADRAQGVFQGKIYVDRIAQRTDGYQLSNTVLLSPMAAMHGKPELEIYADDVKCSHGSTTGPIDGDALFYLQSRGLGEDDARRLVLQAYCAEVIDRLQDEHLRQLALESVEAWLARHL